MKILLSGSICLSDLIDQAKKKNEAFTKGSNGKIYFNFSQWLNEDPDQYGNHSSLKLNPPKDSKSERVYFANAKRIELTSSAEALTESDIEGIDEEDLPF